MRPGHSTATPIASRPRLDWIPVVVLLGSCGSPPKAPTVDEALKRPVNSAQAMELQICRHELKNARITEQETGRVADLAAATLARVSARQQGVADGRATARPVRPNSVYTVRFGFASTRVVVPADIAGGLVEEARLAPLVLLRGRTDGAVDSTIDGRVARERAAAVRDYLVAAGVDAARIRATYQPAGDFVANNATPTGRGMNRRVEIEVYRELPASMPASTTGGLPATADAGAAIP